VPPWQPYTLEFYSKIDDTQTERLQPAPHQGIRFDDFLKEEGIYDAVNG
jgi:hypothetical protein